MRKLNFRSLFFLLISLIAFSVVSAQNKTTKKVKSPKGFEVQLPVAVTDKKKRPVANLTDKDFVVLENGRRQKIKSFSVGKTDLPVYVGVLMDTSASTKGKLRFSKESAMNFIYVVVKQPTKIKVAFMTFDEKISLRQDFTDKYDLLERAVERVNETGQKTALYDAIWQFSDEKLRNAPGRRVIIVISDSEDDFSRAKIEDAIDIAQRTETVIYTISTAEMITDKKPDDKVLQLTSETGGASYFTVDMLALERALKKVLDELNSQYIITYRPKNQKPDGKERKIEVRLKEKKNPDYTVRTKRKYRAIKPN